MNRFDLLWQQDVWLDKAGVVHRLDEMDPDHRANLIPFLRRSASEMHKIALVRAARRLADDALSGTSRWERGVNAELWEGSLWLTPEQFMESCPLMVRLKHLEAQRRADDPAAALRTKFRNIVYRLRHPEFVPQQLVARIR